MQPVRDGGESGVAFRCNTARPGTTTSGASSDTNDPRPSTIRLYPPGSAGGHTSVTSACAAALRRVLRPTWLTSKTPSANSRVDGHRMRAEIVADSDQVGKREVGQRLCELLQVDRDTHAQPDSRVAALLPSEGALWRPRISLPGRADVGTPFSAITSPETMVAT